MTTLTQANLTNVSPGVWTFTASHRYFDDNKTGTSGDTYRISVRVNDDDAGVVSESTTFVVKNAAPVITVMPVNFAIPLKSLGETEKEPLFGRPEAPRRERHGERNLSWRTFQILHQ